MARFAEESCLDPGAREVLQRFVDLHVEGRLVTIDTESWSTFSQATTLHDGDDRDPTEARARPEPTPDQDRYVMLGPIGQGGMGEVVRVRDMALNRIVAMKIMRNDWVGRAAAEARFVAEAQATAQLQHPGVVPVHDIGRLPDGRWFFTMKELRGHTLEQVLAAPPPLRRMLEIFRSLCDAVAYAHSRGAVHRDLKPANVVVADFGEVVVLDWGLVKATGGSESPIHTTARPAGAWGTKAGAVMGTPAYMAPEQAASAAEVGPEADVYALGAVLYEVLAGRPPYEGESVEILEAVRAGPPEPLPSHLPEELRALCAHAMARDPAARPSDAAAVAEALTRWLDGAARREKALAIVIEADELQPAVEGALARARHLRDEARLLRQEVAPWGPLPDKREIWRREDDAREAQREADMQGIRRIELLRAALVEDPGLEEARERLAYVYHWCHERAVERGDEDETLRYELLLREHDTGTYAAYLAGTGRLTVHTEPVRARATLLRWVERDRRLVPEVERDLGTTPIVGIQLPIGSWLLRLEAQGRATVHYPVLIRRDEHWDAVPPGGLHPIPVWLPGERDLGLDDVYVPGGYALLGGDADPLDPRPPEAVWVEPFVIQRNPVTNADWIGFLDFLARRGHEEEALAHVPRAGRSGRRLFERTPEGGFRCGVDDEGDRWLPDHPVTCVTLASVQAYAAWLHERTGRPWRVPWEAEWEKAARGVDGRPYPWGPHFDPTWANVVNCSEEVVCIATVGQFPGDESLYGMRHATGMVHELCNDRWFGDTFRVRGGRPVLEAAGDADFRILRGGCRTSDAMEARLDHRLRLMAGTRSDKVGVRLARSLEEGRSLHRGVAWRLGG